jgi:hypothetical protein
MQVEGHEAREREAREQRGDHQADDALTEHRDVLADHRPAVHHERQRRLRARVQRGVLGRHAVRHRVQLVGAREEAALVRVQAERQPAPPALVDAGPERDDPADRRVAVLQRKARGGSHAVDRRVERHARRRLAAIDEQLGPRADRRHDGLDEQLAGPRRRDRLRDDRDVARPDEVQRVAARPVHR